MKRNMYKILGASVIIALFLLSSISTVSLAATPGREEEKREIAEENIISARESISSDRRVMKGSVPVNGGMMPGGGSKKVQGQSQGLLPLEVYWNGVGDLNYEWDGDGQDGGQYYGETYVIPEEWEMVDCESLPFPVPEGIEDWWKPQYVCTAILVKRVGDIVKFKAIVRNIGLPSLQPFVIRARVWKVLPFPPVEETKWGILGGLGVGWRRVITDSYPWSIYGGTVVVWTDWGNQVDEYLDSAHLLPRIRRFVSNSIPGAYTSLRWYVPWNW